MKKMLHLMLAGLVVFAFMANGVLCQAVPIIPVSYAHLHDPYAYPDTGNVEMTDGIFGTTNYNDAAWTGWQRDVYGLPLIVFDFGSNQSITSLSIYAMNYPGAGIAPIQTFSVSFSNDNVTYGTPVSFTTTSGEQAGNPGLTTFTRTLSGSGRYLKLSVDSLVGANPYCFVCEVTFQAVPIVPISYTHLNAPYGYPDTGNVEMTDGIYGTTNYADAAWSGWYRDMGLPLIVFDFGSGQPITSLSIFSLNYPGVGIAPIETFSVSFSNDNVTYSTPVSFTTTTQERAGDPGLTTITRNLSGSGRYLKLSVDSNGNNGGTPYAFVDEVTFVTPAIIATLALENTQIKVVLDNGTGRIMEIWNKQTTQRYVSNISNAYTYYTGLDNSTISYDTLDNVSNVVIDNITGGQVVTYTCTNKDPAGHVLNITKKYTLYNTEYRVHEKLTLSNPPGDNTSRYLVVKKNVTLDSTFRNGGTGSPGYYYTNMTNSAVDEEPATQSLKNGATPYVPASLVTTNDRINGTVGKGLCFVRPDLNSGAGYGFGWYPYTVNGYFTDGHVPSFPTEGILWPQSYYTPAGWSTTAFTAHCYPGSSDAIETAYTVFPGDQIKFAQDYQTLPGYDTAFSYTVPGWVKRSIASNGGFSYLSETCIGYDIAWFAQNLTKMEGYMASIWEYGYYSLYFTYDDPSTPNTAYDCDGFYPTNLFFLPNLQTVIGRHHDNVTYGKKFKAGMYGTYFPVRQSTGSQALLTSHPGFFKRDASGTAYTGKTTCGNPSWLREICGKDGSANMVNYMLKQLSDLTNYLNTDFVFLDMMCLYGVIGDNDNGTFGFVDWGGMNNYHKDSGSWFRLVGSLPQSLSDNSTTGPKAVFENNTTDRGPSLGYHEGPFPYWFAWTDGWKVAGAKLFNAKLYASKNRYNQVCGAAVPNGMSQDTALKLMFNYTIPFSIGLQTAVGSTDFQNKMPWYNLTAEFRDCEIINAGATPCWWKTGGNTETYSLSLDNSTIIIPVIYHGTGSTNVTVGLDTTKTTLDPAKKTFVYELSIPALDNYTPVSDHVERIVTQSLTSISSSFSSFSYNLSVPAPDLVKFIMISQIPGFIYRINGLVTDNASSVCPQAWLPRELDVDISSATLDEINHQVTLNVNIDNSSGLLDQTNSIEVAVYFPSGWGTPVCKVDNVTVASAGALTLNGTQFVRVGVQGIGTHTVNVRVNAAPTVTVSTDYSTYTAPATINITANASDTDGTISKVEFYNNGILLGTDNNSAGGWTCQWTNVEASGSNGISITSKAYDNDNATTTSSPVGVTVTDSNLKCYWKFNENTGTSAGDSSGTGNAGSITGATWTTGKISYALSFNGTSNYVQKTGATGLPKANDNQTESLWFYVSSNPTVKKTALAVTGSSSAVNIGFTKVGTTMYFGVWKNNGTLLDNTTSLPTAGAWHHVAYTKNGSTNSLYIDGGTPITSTTATDSAAATTINAGRTATGADYWPGKIDEVRIYKRVLSGTEISALAQGKQ